MRTESSTDLIDTVYYSFGVEYNRFERSHVDRGFSFSGFGPSSGGATPGTFAKTQNVYPTGSHDEIRKSDGAVTRRVVGPIHGLDYVAWSFDAANEAGNPSAKALSKLYSEIQGQNPNLGTAVGEGKETIALLRKALLGVVRPVNTLSKLVLAAQLLIKRRDATLKALAKVAAAEASGNSERISKVKSREKARVRRQLNSDLNAIAKETLQVQLAIKPLIGEIGNAISHARDLRAIPITVKGRATMQDMASVDLGFGATYSKMSSRRIEYSVTYAITDPDSFEADRLGLYNIAGLAWELLPLSFVLDYVVHIGESINQLHSSLGIGLQFLGGYYTTTSLVEVSGNQTYILDAPFSTTKVQQSWRAVSKQKERALLSGFPCPTNVSITPPFKASNAANRLVTLAALTKVLLFR